MKVIIMPISWLWSLLRGAEDKGPVGTLYADIVAQARSPYFYSELTVSDDVDGRFDMITLHMFLALDRMREDASLMKLSQKLANLVISDMDRSLREMGVGDLGVGKRVQEMGKAMYGRLEMYDLSLLEADTSSVLSAAIMRNLYRSEESVSENAQKISKYILKQREYLKKCSSETILNGHFDFEKPEELIRD